MKNKTATTKNILAIETSCDETAAAVLAVANGKIATLSSVVKSQIAIHKKFGGVVPEAAARAHIKNIRPVVEKALADAKIKIENLDYIAVTRGPGLIPSLIVGVEFAKALSLAAGIPVIPVNHMTGHLYSPFGKIQDTGDKIPDTLFPMISLIVSGGHTILVLMENLKKYRVLGETVDDAAGEAFDKVAKLLRLPYPGGPEVSKLAIAAKQPVDFPRPMINDKTYNFSFSGLKTAVLYYLRDNPLTAKNYRLKADVCAGFQNAVVDVLTAKTARAVKEFGAKSISLSGGVAANSALQEALNLKSEILNLKLFVPPFNLCTDNAEMIGLAAAYGLINKTLKPVPCAKIAADPNLSL